MNATATAAANFITTVGATNVRQARARRNILTFTADADTVLALMVAYRAERPAFSLVFTNADSDANRYSVQV